MNIHVLLNMTECKTFYTYKGNRYPIDTGVRGGNYIMVDGDKKYIKVETKGISTESPDPHNCCEIVKNPDINGDICEYLKLCSDDDSSCCGSNCELNDLDNEMLYCFVKNKFSDGSSIDWWIYENPNSAWLMNGYAAWEVISPKYSNIELFRGNKSGKLTIQIPISRYYNKKFLDIEVSTPYRISDLLHDIYEFYNQQIKTRKALFQLSSEKNSCYYQEIVNKLQRKEKVRYFELLGNTNVFGDVNPRRNPHSCNGLVRYNGLKKIDDDVYELKLSS
jgi:hypothetical protein